MFGARLCQERPVAALRRSGDTVPLRKSGEWPQPTTNSWQPGQSGGLLAGRRWVCAKGIGHGYVGRAGSAVFLIPRSHRGQNGKLPKWIEGCQVSALLGLRSNAAQTKV